MSTLRKIRFTWPFGSVVLIAIGLALLAAPAQLEGRELVPISPGHALSVLDSIALIPLLIGITWLEVGVWVRRKRFYEFTRLSPQKSLAVIFLLGLGLGLLLASAFSTFFWWWAVGASLLGAMLLIVVIITTRELIRDY